MIKSAAQLLSVEEKNTYGNALLHPVYSGHNKEDRCTKRDNKRKLAANL